MPVTYDGGLGTTVRVRGVDTSVPIGFDSTLVLVGEGTDEGDADDGDVTFLSDRTSAEDAFGEDSELATAFTAARTNGANNIYGVSVEEDEEGGHDYYSAFKEAMKFEPRFICTLEEGTEVATDLLEVLTEEAENFRFARGVVASEEISVDEISDYEPAEMDKRIVEVAPKYCTVNDNMVKTAAAVAGRLAAQPLGSSISYDRLNGVDELGTDYLPTEAGNFEGVTAVIDSGEVIEGVTTSDEPAFSDVFQVEIVDEATMGLYEIAKEYAGEANTEDERNNLASDMRIYLSSLANQSPPLLSDASGENDPYIVETELGSSDEEVNVNVGMSPLNVMKQINVDIDVGTVVRFSGISTE